MSLGRWRGSEDALIGSPTTLCPVAGDHAVRKPMVLQICASISSVEMRYYETISDDLIGPVEVVMTCPTRDWLTYAESQSIGVGREGSNHV